MAGVVTHADVADLKIRKKNLNDKLLQVTALLEKRKEQDEDEENREVVVEFAHDFLDLVNQAVEVCLKYKFNQGGKLEKLQKFAKKQVEKKDAYSAAFFLPQCQTITTVLSTLKDKKRLMKKSLS